MSTKDQRQANALWEARKRELQRERAAQAKREAREAAKAQTQDEEA